MMGFIFSTLFLLNFMALAAERHVAMVYRPGARCIFVTCAIFLCNWIWFGNSMDEDGKEFLKFLVGCGVVICVFSFGAFAWGNEVILQPSRPVVPLLALGTFRTLWIIQHLLCS